MIVTLENLEVIGTDILPLLRVESRNKTLNSFRLFHGSLTMIYLSLK